MRRSLPILLTLWLLGCESAAVAEAASDAGPTDDLSGASCNNGVQDPGEAGIDCGGACGACQVLDVGDPCGLGGAGDGCDACSNGVKDPDELGVDCGGPCDACEVLPACTDGVANGDETDVDCGGTCGPCGVGKSCRAWSDCVSETCLSGTCAAIVDPCFNGIADLDETDVDCGGLDCAQCGEGDTCEVDADCASLPCIRGVCAAPTCFDDVKNGGETGVDCGGLDCVECAQGVACESDLDCESFSCDLVAPGGPVCAGCSDGRQNGDETGSDCGGGLCDECGVGQGCEVDLDCLDTLLCEDGGCCTPNACGDACGTVPAEVCNGIDDDCDGATDEALVGPACSLQVGECAGAVATCKGALGWQCGAASYDAVGVYEGVEVSCDGKDNDCDGDTDEGECAACSAGVEVLSGFDAWADLAFGDEFFGWSDGLATVVATGTDDTETRWLLVSEGGGEPTPLASSGYAAPSLAVGPEGRFVSHVGGGDLTVLDLSAPEAAIHVRNVGLSTTALPIAQRGNRLAVGFASSDGYIRVDIGNGLDADGSWSVADLGLAPDVSGLALAMTDNGTVHALWRQGGTLVHGNPLGIPYVVDPELTGPADLAVAEDSGLYVAYVRGDQVLLRRRDPSWEWFGETVVGEDAASDAVAVALDSLGARFVAWSPSAGHVALTRVSKLGPEPLGQWELSNVGVVERVELVSTAQGVFRLAAVLDLGATRRVVTIALCP